MARKNHGSKWTAEFAVAAELSRRGYTVAFTQGSHTPGYDLIAAAPNGEAFAVDVKGMASRGTWLVKNKESQATLFYVLALVPPAKVGGKPDQFFILTQEEVRACIWAYCDRHPHQKDHGMSGFDWIDAVPHENAWGKLPGADIA